MKLTFLGTRGNIEPSTRRHRKHTSTLVAHRGRGAVIDWGEDWRGTFPAAGTAAVVVTHPHPDHVGGLKEGCPCPVYATGEAWDVMEAYPISRRLRRVLRPRQPEEIAGILFEAFPVVHSIRAPAVGYRITAGRVTLFYVPDVVRIPDQAEALAGAKLYIGDGATLEGKSLLHQDAEGNLIGHTPVRTQLGWCRDAGVPRMIVTHCGSDIVAEDGRTVRARLLALGRERGVRAEIAHDGMELVLR